ncbi:hypothetical protein [uncultured Porphyromonas sp.]|uniref:hypothetical protein n=1 Tax=uncultured Porphyromonas sp. TaxID=159274 RepID=UPI0026241EDC|nr:hypothetical protein [uncultured Porphyromonas sp.]
MNTYHPSTDSFAIWITITILILCAYMMYEGLAHQSGAMKWIVISIAALTAIVPLFFYPFRESFDRDSQKIRIHFLGYTRIISRENYPILLTGQDLINDGAIRRCASGGLFGYWGKWKSGDGRNFTSYITHRKENVYYLSDGTNIIAINAPNEWIYQMYKSTLLGEEGGGDH